MNRPSYIIASGPHQDMLEDKVLELINKGYEPHGSIAIMGNQLIQPMICKLTLNQTLTTARQNGNTKSE